MAVKIGGLYRHYNGGQMVVIDVVTHPEDNERLAIYIHNGKKWARPERMFSDVITVNGEDKPRFEYLGQYLDIGYNGGANKNVK